MTYLLSPTSCLTHRELCEAFVHRCRINTLDICKDSYATRCNTKFGTTEDGHSLLGVEVGT